MSPRPGLPALHPLVLPEARPPLPEPVRAVAVVFARAEQAYGRGDPGSAWPLFLAAARSLRAASAPGLPDLSGARTVCYVDALLATRAAQASGAPGAARAAAEIRREVAEQDPTCAQAVAALTAGS